jgi:hypothetical protein
MESYKEGREYFAQRDPRIHQKKNLHARVGRAQKIHRLLIIIETTEGNSVTAVVS